MGLLLAVSLTVANGGRRLIADCHPGLMDPSIPLDQGPGHTDCPFDPTRIYVRFILAVGETLVLTFALCAAPASFQDLSSLFLWVLGYSLGSLDPFSVHVCSRGCTFCILLCGCTHTTGHWALQEGRVAGTGKEEEQEGLVPYPGCVEKELVGHLRPDN